MSVWSLVKVTVNCSSLFSQVQWPFVTETSGLSKDLMLLHTFHPIYKAITRSVVGRMAKNREDFMSSDIFLIVYPKASIILNEYNTNCFPFFPPPSTPNIHCLLYVCHCAQSFHIDGKS